MRSPKAVSQCLLILAAQVVATHERSSGHLVNVIAPLMITHVVCWSAHRDGSVNSTAYSTLCRTWPTARSGCGFASAAIPGTRLASSVEYLVAGQIPIARVEVAISTSIGVAVMLVRVGSSLGCVMAGLFASASGLPGGNPLLASTHGRGSAKKANEDEVAISRRKRGRQQERRRNIY